MLRLIIMMSNLLNIIFPLWTVDAQLYKMALKMRPNDIFYIGWLGRNIALKKSSNDY